MEKKDRDQQQNTHGGNQGTAGNENKFGNKSFASATTTDFDKQRMQTVEANELDDNNPREGNTNYDGVNGTANTDQSRSQADNRTGAENEDDIIDSGSIRTAAFDENSEPRSNDSLENRGITQGSNDEPSRH